MGGARDYTKRDIVFAIQSGGVVSGFPSAIRFTFGYVDDVIAGLEVVNDMSMNMSYCFLSCQEV